MSRTVQQALTELRRLFADSGIEAAAFDSRLLLTGLLGIDATGLISRSDDILSDHDDARIDDAARRRLKGEPVHRILGWRAFYTITLELSADTLEPRPDTEILIDALLPHIHRIVEAKGTAEILDLGTGTGAIGLALLDNAAKAHVTATDISPGALATAQANALRNGLANRFKTLKSHWFAHVEGKFDVIVSNPPYIATGIVAGLAPEVRLYDPPLALDGGADGLDAYRAIARNAASFLAPGGIVGVEIGFDQKQSVADLFESHGFLFIECRLDLAGNDRVLIFGLGAEK